MQTINHRFDIASVEGITSKRAKSKRDNFSGYVIKVKAECDQSFLKKLSHGEAPDFDGFFFEDDGTLKPSYVSGFTVSRVIEDHKLRIDLDLVSKNDMHFIKIGIPEFKVIPVLGFQYVIAFSVRIETSDDELLFLNKAFKQDQVILQIEEPPVVSAF